MLVCLKIALGIVVFGSFLYLNIQIIDPDLGWHLRVGEETFTTWAVPRTDHFSFTMAGTPWVDHEWLQNAALWRLEAHGLWRAAVLFFALVASAPFFIWLWRARDLAEISVVLFAALLLTGFLGVRPQVISFLFFFLCFEVGSRFFSFCHSRESGNPGSLVFFLRSWIPGQAGNDNEKKRYAKKTLFGALLVLLFFIWANLHAGFAAGLLLLFLMWAGKMIALWQDERKLLLPDAGEMGVMGLAALIPLINPYGLGLYGEVFRVLRSSTTARFITEWQPAFTVFGASSLLWMFIGIFIFLAVKYKRVLSPSLLVPASVFFLLFMRSARMGPLFLVVAVPLLFEGIRYARREIAVVRAGHSWPAREKSAFRWAGTVFCMIPLALLGFTAVRAEPPSFPAEPIRILESRQKSGETVRLFHEYGWGGHIIGAAPDIPVFVDGRMPHWRDGKSNSAMEEYVSVLYGDAHGWRSIFEKYRINAVLIRNQKGRASHGAAATASAWEKAITALTKDPRFDLEAVLRKEGWEALYEDTGAILLTKN